MAATCTTPDDRTKEIASLVAVEMKKHLDPVQGLLKLLEAPASKAGVSPMEMLQKMANDGNGNIFAHAGGDGAMLSAPYKMARGCGMGDYLSDLYKVYQAGPLTDTARKIMQEKHQSRFFDPSHEKAALAENSGVTGGYTVPPQFMTEILRLAIEPQLIRPRARVIPMTSMTAQIPAFDYTTTGSTGNTPFTSGVVAKWTSEAATRDETEPVFKQVELKAWELSLYTLASNNLLADSAAALDTVLTQLFAMAIGWYSDFAFLRGDGVGKPEGMLNAPAAIGVSRAVASKIKLLDILKMQSQFLMQSWGNGIWLAHQSTIPQLGQISDGDQTSSFAFGRNIILELSGGATKKLPSELLGMPLFFTEKLPVLGTAGDLMLIDPGMYLIGDRMEMQIDVSQHYRFLNNQMVWRVVVRFDGRSWLNKYITLADGAHQVSPFLYLS